MKESVVIIPAYEPTVELISIIREVLKHSSERIVIVDDGSGSKEIFAQLPSDDRLILLKHSQNKGKGEALKTAFSYCLNNLSTKFICGVVTADADGQHAVSDILHLCEAQKCNPGQLILGVRNFSISVPLRNRIGNLLTCTLFRFFFRKSLQDTQTGLRGIPFDFLRSIRDSKLKGYEFELEMLLKAIKQGLTFKQIPIETIYFAKKGVSHFRPLRDSFRIYSLLFYWGIMFNIQVLNKKIFPED